MMIHFSTIIKIALERGLVSPLRSRRTSPRANDFNAESSYEGPETLHVGNRKGAESDAEPRNRHINEGRTKEEDQIDETAAALMAAMNLIPNNSK